MLMWLVNFVLTLAAFVLAVPAFVFIAECLLALLPGGDDLPLPRVDKPLRKAMLMPAHNEEAGIAATLRTIMPQLGPDDRCLVIADNCSDGTAAAARAEGALVAERSHETDRGKGFALAFGIDELAKDPPDIVIIVDADIELSEGSVDALARLAYTTNRPVQADYLVVPEKMTPISVISALAFLVRNRVRARGLRVLELPCHLTGTGMGFTWDVIRKAPPTGAYLVEDLLMGLELAMLGHPPLYTSHARVLSGLPDQSDAALKQRKRWEHGQMTTVRNQAPRLLRAGIREGRVDLFALGLDLLVPPLALLVVLLVAGWLGALGAYWLGVNINPLLIFTFALFGVGSAVLASWWRFGRTMLPAKYVLAIPLYVLWKVPVYASYIFRGGEKKWERTERAAKPPTEG
jgi:cellulose synthase/poly-beta-1,6-N-acetylglucosamine synthase-like glycosyltransferase